MRVAHAKTRAVHENAEASNGKASVLTMRGLSKTVVCERVSMMLNDVTSSIIHR
jgi:hypothetical protein